ncbi:transcriptional regulator [Yersinia sp. 2466 StPb PI]|uniref:winged helix-turn-helix domain-containing protein n=1 Tax=Yersinia sp. 2466 StPb PI TaxID=3061648 RepID=UPI00355B9D37
MDKSYIINGNVIFYPGSGIVSSLLTGNTVKLNAPTAQLLEAFVSRVGMTISQSELYNIAWGEKGSSVTPNTLYQNISLLRKALKDVGVIGESVTTVRGKGFIFTMATVIENMTDNEIVKNISLECSDNKTKKKMIIVYSIMMGVCFILILLYFFIKSQPGYFVARKSDGFSFSHINEKCFIYYDNSNDMNSIIPDIDVFLEGTLSSCQVYPYVYISLSELHSTISLTSCKNEIINNSKNVCKTELFYDFDSLNR